MRTPATAHGKTPDALALLDALREGVIVLDEHNRVRLMNATAEELFATSRKRCMGRELRQIADAHGALIELIASVRERGGTRTVRELSVVPLAQPEAVRLYDVLASSGDDGDVFVEFRDAHTRVAIRDEAALVAQHGVVRAMVRRLAHEIKNPLGGVRGAAQLLERRLPSAELREYTQVIIKEADRLTKLVDTMLGPNGPAEWRAVNVHRLLDHVHRLLLSEAHQGVVITLDYDPSLPKFTADEDRLLQALLNLGRNAVQALDDQGGGDIVLRTRAETGFHIGATRHPLVLRIDIEDSGPGVPESLREQIFFPLVTGRPRGTGLGLAVAQDLISRHGGLIKLMPAERTTFSVFLPLNGDQAAAATT